MKKISRRGFLCMAAAGGAAIATTGISGCAQSSSGADGEYPELQGGKAPEAQYDPATGKLTVNDDVLIRYGTCVGCYSYCGIRYKIDRNTKELIGAGGNPYNPANTYPYLEYDEPLEEAYLSMVQAPERKCGVATVCGRSLATIQTYSQPDRILTPLKRAGKRGEGKWEPISWDQLVTELVEGGKLFESIGEDREIEGFRAVYNNKDLIDPESPEFGTVSNQLVCLGGRTDGITAMAGRFVEAFGSVNQYGHHSSCMSARGVMMYQLGYDDGGVDCENGEYSIWLGMFPGANGNGVMSDPKRLIPRLENDQTKLDVFDPNLGSGVVTPTQKNVAWHPIKPATNAAFCLAMIRWMMDNNAHDTKFLSYPNYNVAREAGYNACTNATHLVVVDESSELYGTMLRPEQAGLSMPSQADPIGDSFVVIDAATGKPAVSTTTKRGQLEFEGKVNGIAVRTAYLFVKDAAYERSFEEYCEICEVPAQTVADVTKEFTSHGTKASMQGMGGLSNLNGVDSTAGVFIVNSFIGSINMEGGFAPGYFGAPDIADGDRYLLGTIEGAPAPAAVGIDRTGMAWEQTSEYKRRVKAGEKDPQPLLPWYDFNNGKADNQALMSIASQYPYSPKILFSWRSDLFKATPGGLREEMIERFKDPEVVPLHIACDIIEGTQASIADYIIPDQVIPECFGSDVFIGQWAGSASFIHWRALEPKTEDLGDGRHAGYTEFICDVASRLGMPGFGKGALKSVDGKSYDFFDPADIYLKAFANIAYFEEPVKDLPAKEAKMQGLDELPESWRKAVTEEEWPKVLKVLSRGGRTWSMEGLFDEKGRHTLSGPYMTNLYSEERASYTNSLTGKHYDGSFRWRPERFADLTPIEDVYSREEYPFAATTYKPRFRSVSTLSNNPVMRELCPHNYIEMNVEDAKELGIADGDKVRVTNPSGDVMEGEAWVRGGTARGNLGFAFGYKQIAYGSTDRVVGDEVLKGDPAIAAGVNMTQMQDPTVAQTETSFYAIAEPEGATPGRNGGMFKVEKA